MANRVLRDHSEPCEVCRHFSPEVHDGFLKPQRTCLSCHGAGGREVTIDYEAAVDALDTNTDHAGPPTWEDMVAAVRVMVAAALGDV